MRQIEREMLDAVVNGNSFSKSNTLVTCGNGVTEVYLHGNLIFRKDRDNLLFSNGGWSSNTTKSRINVLLGHFGLEPTFQKDYVWYWDERLQKVDDSDKETYIIAVGKL